MKRYADISRTQTKSSFNPLIDDYSNMKFYLSQPIWSIGNLEKNISWRVFIFICGGFIAYCDEITCKSTFPGKNFLRMPPEVTMKNLVLSKMAKKLGEFNFFEETTKYFSIWTKRNVRPSEVFKPQDMFHQSLNLKWVITQCFKGFLAFSFCRYCNSIVMGSLRKYLRSQFFLGELPWVGILDLISE